MIENIIKKFFSFFGLVVNRKVQMQGKVEQNNLNPFTDFDYGIKGFEAVNLTKNNSMMPPINLITLYEQAVYCEKKGIQGSFVECGVWKGGAVGIMAKANLDYGAARRSIHLFDAFDDICAPVASVDGARAIFDMKKYGGIENEEEMNGELKPVKGAYDFLGGHGTIDACKELLEDIIKYPSEHVYYHKGWFQDTVPIDSYQIDKIAILRLDGDWYDSIKICLDNLFEKVVIGGLVIIDDYGYYDGCTKAVDEFLEKRNIKTFLSYSSVGCRYFVKN